MKATIHPTYFENAQVICVCGNRFVTGSTKETIHVELCNKCHPFYTGEQRFLDRGSLIQKFQNKQKAGAAYQEKKKAKTSTCLQIEKFRYLQELFPLQ